MGKKQVLIKKRIAEDKIHAVVPKMLNTSGIYIFHKIDENGFKGFYAGQAKHLIERTASHLREFDHIAFSLRKHGFKNAENPYGWELDFFYCKENDLDEREKETIAHWHIKLGYAPYNKTIGGQGVGKNAIGEYKPAKGYYEGLRQGEKNIHKFVAHLFEKNLDYTIKGKTNKIKEKAYEKFKTFLSGEDTK